MANLGRKNGIYHVRFRFRTREYKKSLKIRSKDDAQAAQNLVELTIHRLTNGTLQLPQGIDPGEFIVSGGTLSQPIEPILKANPPSTKELIEDYKQNQRNLLAESYLDSQAMHLRHLVSHIGDLAGAPCDQVTYQDLDRYLKARLGIRKANTVERERISLMQFYKWVVRQGHLPTSPATGLSPIKGGVDRPPFRTIAEINRIIERGGLSESESLALWECLYLSPEEIAGLLATVRTNAREDFSYLLHAIPAYTGVRRGEMLRLRWLDVELDEGYIIARSRKQSRKKTETVRRIDMHPELQKELLAWREKRPKGQFVLCDAKNLEPIDKHRANRSFWQPLRNTPWCLDRRKNWYKISFHSYRHSFASNLAAVGVDQRVIDEFMGHQTEAMRKRYRHLFPRTRRSAIESFSLGTKTPMGTESCQTSPTA
jgi:integrase